MVIVIILITFLFCLILMLLQGVTNINCIKVLSYKILESPFSLTEWYHYGIVCLMVLLTLIVLIVLKVDSINFGIIKMFYITGKPTLLGPGTEVYVHYNILFKFSLV